MNFITRLKKIIALSLFIAIIPSPAHAGWWDSLKDGFWGNSMVKAIGANTTTIALGTIGAVFGFMWWRSSKAHAKTMQELETVKKINPDLTLGMFARGDDENTQIIQGLKQELSDLKRQREPGFNLQQEIAKKTEQYKHKLQTSTELSKQKDKTINRTSASNLKI